MDQTEYVEELVPGEVDGRLKDDQLLADTWAELGGGSIDRIIRTDSKSLYDHVLLKGTCTTPYDRIEDQEE
jgi:hypothetical protein